MKINIFRIIFVVLAGFVAWSCDKLGNSSVGEDVINLVVEDYSVSTKAHIINNEDFKDESKGGGSFSLSAWNYDKSTPANAQQYIEHELVWYRAGDEGQVANNRLWRFKRGDELVECYWPYNGVSDFLAYMPVHEKLDQVGISNIGYSPETGISYTANLPLSNNGEGVTQENLREFLYAVAEDETPQNSASGVGLEFQHPLTAIYFKVAKSYRMTINTIEISYLKNSGKFSNNTWTFNDSQEMTLMTLQIDKKIPEDINYGVVFYGPVLVLPQDLDDINITVTGTRTAQNDYTMGPVPLKINSHGQWESGKAYTYSLNLGEQNVEVLFDVTVQNWDEVNYKHNIDIE